MKHCILSILTLSLLAPAIKSQAEVAIKAGRVITISGAEMSDAVILIENGKIKAIGKDIEIPWNARVIDASDKVVMPTYVLAHSSGGMSGANERMANVPFIDIEDGIDPSSPFFAECLRNGIGSIHVIPGHKTLIGGVGMVVRPYGKTVEEMRVRTRSGMKLSLDPQGGSRMGQIRKLRRALQDVIDHGKEIERQRQEFAKEKAAGATDKQEFDGKPDEQKQPVLDLLAGKMKCYLYVPSAAELAEAGRLKETFGLDLILVLGPACYRGAEDLKELGLPVILESNLEFLETDPETLAESITCPAQVFAAAGLDFALSISSQTTGSARYPWWQMATAIRYGMDRDAVLRAMTITPAKILGIDGEFGTLEPGKVANLQILTGDPLAATSWVDSVLLEGELVYERSKDHRLQHLFGTSKE